MLIDFEITDDLNRYKLMSKLITPRPIAWIVTQNSGVDNIAPFSYFAPLSSNPATVVVSIGHKDDLTPKDTLANILETKKCTICMPSVAQKKELECTATSLRKEESEAVFCGINLRDIFDDFPPIVEGSKIAFGCIYHSEIVLEESDTIPIVLQIKKLFIDDEIITDNSKIRVAFDALGRVGAGFVSLNNID